MRDKTIRFTSCRLSAVAALLGGGLGACAGDDEPELSRDLGQAMAGPGAVEDDIFGPPPEYSEALCQSVRATVSVEGPGCGAREVFTCEDASTLQARLESFLNSCGFFSQGDPLEIFMSEGCVTGFSSEPSSLSNEPGVLGCLIGELGAIRAACREQPTCVRLDATAIE